MTDADVFRGMAATYNEAAQGQESASGIRALINEANLYTRAADAIEENARLRAAIEDLERQLAKATRPYCNHADDPLRDAPR